MSNLKQRIAENLLSVRERMARAAEGSGRSAESVQLIAVSKYVGPQVTAAMLAAGCPILGESRPQQLWEKTVEPELAAARWHLIGHLQRNKVRRTLPLVEMIHSVDSLRLLKTIDDISGELGESKRVLIEINCSGEAEKHGLAPDELQRLLPELPPLKHVEVCGLMTMAAREGGEVVAAKNFNALRQLRDQIQPACPPGVLLTELSMGMSHDFEVAIRAGASLVRIGSLLLEGIQAS